MYADINCLKPTKIFLKKTCLLLQMDSLYGTVYEDVGLKCDLGVIVQTNFSYQCNNVIKNTLPYSMCLNF